MLERVTYMNNLMNSKMSLKKSGLCRPSQNIWPMITASSRIQIRVRGKQAEGEERTRTSQQYTEWLMSSLICHSVSLRCLRCFALSFHISLWKPREFSYMSHSWFANRRNERVGLLRCVHIVHRTRKGWSRYKLRLLIWDFVTLCYYAAKQINKCIWSKRLALCRLKSLLQFDI